MVKSCPVCKWSKVVRFANGLVFKWHLNTGLNSPAFGWLGCMITIIMLRYCHSYVAPFEIRTLKSPVFRWIRYSVFRWWLYSDYLIRRTIWIPAILDHKTDIFCPVFRTPFARHLDPNLNSNFKIKVLNIPTLVTLTSWTPKFEWLVT